MFANFNSGISARFKSHILIDLKIGKFDHTDAGQLNVYLSYYKDNEMSDGDNLPNFSKIRYFQHG